MGKKLIFLFFVFLIPFFIFSAGETGADILNERTGGRPLALGEAYTSMADNLEGIAYNPSCISFVKNHEITGSYLWKSFGVTSINGAYAQPIEIFSLEGRGAISFIYRTIPEISNLDALDESVSFYDILIAATFANNLFYFIKNDLLKDIHIGTSIKFIQEQIGNNVGSTFAFDFGFIFLPVNSFYRLGLSLLNVGMPFKTLRANAQQGDINFESSPLPISLRIGGSFSIKIDKDNTSTISLDYVQNFFEASQFAIGVEHSVVNILFLRMGYNMYTDIRQPATLSAGIGVSITTTVPVTVTGELNYVHRIFMWNWFNSPDSIDALSVVFKF
ncbi:MAG: hypothetical protein N2114_04170 [Candidatus Goldbacteria bacterium]|nr:hypothetical protein [Candidatus Goldiibacteriota bacterium]